MFSQRYVLTPITGKYFLFLNQLIFYVGSPQEKDKERLEFEKSETVDTLTRQLEAKVQNSKFLSANSCKY